MLNFKKSLVTLSAAAMLCAIIVPVSASAEQSVPPNVSEDLSIIYQAAQQNDVPSISFGQSSKPTKGDISPLSFSAAATGETEIKLDNALPTVTFATGTAYTTATNILYFTSATATMWYSSQIFGAFALQTTGSKGTGFKSSYSIATTVASQVGFYRAISAHSVTVFSDVYFGATSNTIAKS